MGCGLQTHPGGWCTGRGHCLPPFQCHKQSHFWRRERLVSYSRNPVCLPPPPQRSHPPLSFSQPSPLSVQVAERTSAVGCSLSSPTHGQRSLELPQRATAPLAEDTASQERKAETALKRLTPGRRIKRIYWFPLHFLSFQTAREQNQLCSMRNHAHHLFSQRAAVRLLPTDLPHPHQR